MAVVYPYGRLLIDMKSQQQLTRSNDVLRSLSDTRRRSILRLLHDRSSPVGTGELATNLVAEEQDKPLVEVTRDEVQTVRIDLVHTQLSRLEAADLIEWNRQEDTVSTANHPALSDPKLKRILDNEATEWDAIFDDLAHGRRRIILSALKDHGEAISCTDLAKEVVTRERDAENDHPTDVTEDVLAELHHVHLPKLRQTGLVTYETDGRTVSYEGHPQLEDEWLDARIDETPRAILPTAQHSEAIWSIEGRDNVIARGQSLFEQADDELFLMFTTDGLLEDGCIRRLQDAIDRGVDVYLGSQTQEVRDLARERVPGAVVWEPQMDWLNLPPEYEKVGRLVFADREAIMLATLGEKTEKGVHAETAITGAGENNPLVVLIRDMLGSRLDHLDAQSEDFLTEIPL